MRKKENKERICTYRPTEILQNSHFYQYHFEQIISKMTPAFMDSHGNATYRKRFKQNLPDGVIIPTPEKDKFKGLPIPKDLADKLGITLDNPYNWRLGIDCVHYNYLFFFPNKEDDEGFYINSVFSSGELLDFEIQNIFKNVYIWYESINIRPDIDPFNFKIPYDLMRPSYSDVYDCELEIKRPAYKLFYDKVGNLFYFRLRYTKEGFLDKYYYSALFTGEEPAGAILILK